MLVSLSLGMTLSIGGKGSFEFFKPEMRWEIDPEKPLEPQFDICEEVTKQTWAAMSKVLEKHIKEELAGGK